jgi:hypothetical protein
MTSPVGHLGRGTHHSVLRAACWQGPNLAPLSEAVLHDFAIIWDEDHDARVATVVERIYLAGLLAPILAIGERKGCLAVLISDDAGDALGQRGVEQYEQRLRPLASNLDGDSWTVEVFRFGDEAPIIDASDDEVDLYLRGINLLWALGSKTVPAMAGE